MRLALLAALLPAVSLAQPGVAPDRRAAVDSLARAAVVAHGLPSLVVGVSLGGERTVFGYGDVGGAAPTAGTPFEIGSVTKGLTALALADAVVRGELAPGTPATSLLPDSVNAPGLDGVTLAELATHTSGLPRLPVPFTPASILDPYADYSVDQLLGFASTVVPSGRGAYAYSNVGAGLLAWLLARRDGQPTEAMLHARVLGPLGMTATTSADAPGLAAPHLPDGTPAAPWHWTDALVGAGGLRSTATDLLTLAEALARPERAGALAPAVRLALAPRAASAGRFRVGLMWHLLPEADGAPVGLAFHNGATFGAAAFVGAAPEADVAVVVLTNKGVPAAVDALAHAVVDVLAR